MLPARLLFLLHGTKQRFREWNFFVEITLPGALKAKSNGDDRRRWRKQGGAVGAAASKMRAKAKQMLGAATRICRLSLILDAVRLTVGGHGKIFAAQR